MKILNFGSLNVDYVYKVDHIVKEGETIASCSLETYPGGKGLNQSIALGRAGAEVYHAGAVGKDGQMLIDFLKEAGVHVEYIYTLPKNKSGHAIIQRDKNGDNCIILFGGANQCITREQVDITLGNFDEGDYLLLQNEISELFYIVERAHEKGMKIILNPSPMDETIKKLPTEYIDYFILNEIEAEEMNLKEIFETNPSAKIILTLGNKGSIYLDKMREIAQKAYSTDVVDTTAAGDTYTGYFVAGEARGWPIEMSLDMAARAAAITVSRKGAGVAIPDNREVKEAF